MATVIYNGKSFATVKGETYFECMQRLGIKDALAVQAGGKPLNLNTPAGRDGEVLTLANEEGRRIYERSLRFVTLLACERLYPRMKLRFENSFGHGILITAKGVELTGEVIASIENEMHKIADERLPFEIGLYSKEEATEYYASKGMDDKVAVLKYRKNDFIHLYECGGMKEYFYGEMAHDTGSVSVFALIKVDGGMVLQLPSWKSPDVPAPFKQMPKLLDVFSVSNDWLKDLKVPNIPDLNALTESGKLPEFIRANEALVDKRIITISDMVKARGARLVLIAGPSSSGKTTFANRLSDALRMNGLTPHKLSLDDYYLDRDKVPLDEDGKPDLECVESLDTALINEHLAALLRGEEIQMPEFDFKTGKRCEKTHPVKVAKDELIVIEGIHGLNEKLTSLIPASEKFKIYISALTNINVDDHNRIRTTDARLIRRIVRDAAFRGTDINDTLAMWDSVRRGEDKYIFPFQEEADVMINSSLVYELAVMKKYAYKPLLSVSEDKPYYSIARRLVKFLNYVVPADVEDDIPLNSLLREFIGGSVFYK